MEAHHGVIDDPTRLLRRAGAPHDLVDWTSGRRIDALWDECDRGDWLIWLGVVANIPCVAMVDAAVACVRRAARALPKGPERRPITAALRAARDLTSSPLCAKRALACEKLAGRVEAASYRDAPPTKHAWAAAAAGCAARAAEALLAAEARRQAERDRDGRGLAATLAVADHIISRGDFPPLVFEPDDELMALCVDAAASAIAYAAQALAPGSSETQLEAVQGDLSEVAFAILDPVHEGLRKGTPAAELVRPIVIKPYSDIQLDDPRENELVPLTAVSKRPIFATCLAVVLPVGGIGHLYAEEAALGAMLLCGGLFGIGFVATGHSFLPWLVIVAADAAHAGRALELRKAGKPRSLRSSLGYGGGALLLAFLIALITL